MYQQAEVLCPPSECCVALRWQHEISVMGVCGAWGIDGYSRVITFLSCSTNNRADTVLRKFLGASQEFGFPSRVRSDHGGENYDVEQFMLIFCGLGRISHITGSSTRNQRIERLWRDVFEKNGGMCRIADHHL